MSDNAENNARSWLANIREMIAALQDADDKSRDDLRDEARERIETSALSVQVRGGWYSPGAELPAAEEYEILLTTGGPALRIVGELGQYGEPETARLEWQDWFEPWTVYDGEEGETSGELLAFARVFYFGEG